MKSQLLKDLLVLLCYLLPLFLFVVFPLYFLYLLLRSLDVVLELVRLRLVHVYLRRQLLHLLRLHVQRPLHQRQLLRHLQPRLPLHYLPYLLYLLLLLVHHHLLLHHLLRLENQPLLQGFYFFVHFVRVRISAIQASAAVNVEGIF